MLAAVGAEGVSENIKLVVVVHVVVARLSGSTTEVLLLRRSNTGRGDGTWDCPAGGVEPGETTVAAAARELMEEVGVDVTPGQLVEVYCEDVGASGAGVRHAFLAASGWSGAAKNLEPQRADRLDWFPADGLPEPMLPFVRAGLRATLDV